jgi:indole-3-glycerol phosphate synthase
MNILDEIVVRTRKRIEEKKNIIPEEKVIRLAERGGVNRTFPFERALKGDDLSFICEIKRASPSKGIITNDFDHVQIAKEYQAAGADALSVLTEPYYFHGDDRYLTDVVSAVTIPVLRKDFIVDEYMIYESKLMGASALLLICAILDNDTLSKYIELAHRLGLSALVEVHNEKEVSSALDAGARMIGVNNRNLRTFVTDVSISEQLRMLVPKEKIFVSESGIRGRGEINTLRNINANAVLIGEALMRSSDRTNELRRLRGDADV